MERLFGARDVLRRAAAGEAIHDERVAEGEEMRRGGGAGLQRGGEVSIANVLPSSRSRRQSAKVASAMVAELMSGDWV